MTYITKQAAQSVLDYLKRHYTMSMFASVADLHDQKRKDKYSAIAIMQAAIDATPRGEREALIYWLRERSMWDGMLRLKDAADMLAADARLRKQTIEDAVFELEGMTCNNATARSAIKLCIEAIKEMKCRHL